MTSARLKELRELAAVATGNAQVCPSGPAPGVPCNACGLARYDARANVEDALREWWAQGCEEPTPEEDLRVLLEKGYPRPWHVGHRGPCEHGSLDRHRYNLWGDDQGDITDPCAHLSKEDAELAVAAVNALPRLLMDLRSLRAQVTKEKTLSAGLDAELAGLQLLTGGPVDGAGLLAIACPVPTGLALQSIAAERRRQDEKWGPIGSPGRQYPDGTGSELARSLAALCRDACDGAARDGSITWAHIAGEEFAEALAETDPVKLRAELVQDAAVRAAWIEAIDQREVARG